MALPLIPLAVSTVGGSIGSKVVPILSKGIKNPRMVNASFLRDYGKKAMTENFRLKPIGFKKEFNKVKKDTKSFLQNFLNDFKPNWSTNESGSASNVAFDVPDVNNGGVGNGGSGGGSKKDNLKTPSKFLDGVNGLTRTVRDGTMYGSISLLLFLILFILFAIRPVGDTKETRLTLMFKTILKMTYLEDMADPEELKADRLGFVSSNEELYNSRYGQYVRNTTTPKVEATPVYQAGGYVNSPQGQRLINGIINDADEVQRSIMNIGGG